MMKHMKSIGEFMNSLWNGLQTQDLLKTLQEMYSIISAGLLIFYITDYIDGEYAKNTHRQLYNLYKTDLLTVM